MPGVDTPCSRNAEQGVFGSGILNNNESHGFSDIFWPFISIFIPLTVVTVALWFWRRQLENSYKWGRTRLWRPREHSDLESGYQKP